MPSGICPKCPRPVEPRQWIFQLATGLYVSRFITPTDFSRKAILTEMHVECVEENCLKNQRQPYHCQGCGERIVGWARIIYGVVGRKPSGPWIRPEERGDGLYFVSHVRCWEGRVDNWLRQLGLPM
jgi:hypothetical protein